ncbi:MAG: 30S ribosomal protein S20 [Planctomycetota bacterium]|nr:30S ribosomal protein S20 [Planctomycetota bacterium]
MPNNKQAKKRMNQDVERSAANKVVRSRMRSAMKKVLQAESLEEARKAVPEATKRVDKAAKKNIIHANSAARKKAQLARATKG